MPRSTRGSATPARMPATPDPITVRFRQELGRRLEVLREKCGLDMSAWARRCGVSRQTAYHWAAGTHEPVLSQALEIVEIARRAGVEVTAGWLMGLDPAGGPAVPPVEPEPPQKAAKRGTEAKVKKPVKKS